MKSWLKNHELSMLIVELMLQHPLMMTVSNA